MAEARPPPSTVDSRRLIEFGGHTAEAREVDDDCRADPPDSDQDECGVDQCWIVHPEGRLLHTEEGDQGVEWAVLTHHPSPANDSGNERDDVGEEPEDTECSWGH